MRPFLILALLAIASCDDTKEEAKPPAAEAAAVPAEVRLALTVAKGISANPTAADSVLGAHGLTRGGLDSLLYNIAVDSVKSALYNAARP